MARSRQEAKRKKDRDRKRKEKQRKKACHHGGIARKTGNVVTVYGMMKAEKQNHQATRKDAVRKYITAVCHNNGHSQQRHGLTINTLPANQSIGHCAKATIKLGLKLLFIFHRLSLWRSSHRSSVRHETRQLFLNPLQDTF